MFDVVALGELLIDFVESGSSTAGTPLFEANPGGSPCNVLAMLSRLGYLTAFIGKVGEDSVGRMLGKTIREIGISDEGLIYDRNVNTTLALVHILPGGDRDFSFYRKPGADIMLTEKEVNRKLIDACRVFHFGSLSLTNEPAATATKAAVAYAKSKGKRISFAPNLREPLWESEEQAKKAIWYGIGECDVLKIADHEIKWLTEKEDYDEGVQMIKERSNVKLINVTLGNEGSLAYYMDQNVYGKPFLSDRTVDATGAGDTFCGCVLAFLLEHGLDGLTVADLESMLSFANAAASLATTRKGVICSMPDREEIGALLANYRQEGEEPKVAKSFDIMLGSVDKVKAFVNDMSKIEGDVFLCVGKYVIDAKSIMGIFSLELSKPLRLEIEDWKEEYMAVIEKYLQQ